MNELSHFNIKSPLTVTIRQLKRIYSTHYDLALKVYQL